MAQIVCTKSKTTQSSLLTPTISTTEENNKFVTRDGLEFVLHEFDCGDSSASICRTSSRDYYSIKKRGRPRKNENSSNENSVGNSSNIVSSFEMSPKSEAKKRRLERKMEKLLFRKSLKEKSSDEIKKKRGRPRKIKIDSSIENGTNQSNPNSDYVLDFDSLQNFSSYTCSNSTSGYDSRSSFNDAAGIPEILNYRDEIEKPAAIKQTPTEDIQQ